MTTSNRDDPLADPRVLECIKNPHILETADQCAQVIEALDRSIAHMEAQDAAYQAGDARRDAAWYKRLCYALSMRRNEKRRIERRSKEIRGIETQQQATKRTADADEARLLKEKRLVTDAETRKAKRLAHAATLQIQAMETSHKNRVARRFMEVAKEVLPEADFKAIEMRALHIAHERAMV